MRVYYQEQRRSANMAEVRFVPADEGRTYEVGGDLITIKGGSEDGLGSLFLDETSPPGGGPPPHTDPSEELFFVVDGEIDFLAPGPDGVTTFHATAGDSFLIPKGVAHTYRNAGTEPCRVIVFFRDNERMQPFFEELGDPVDDRAAWTPGTRVLDFERAIAVANKHGIGVVMTGAPAD
jgi:mannose-6-phosphate isomerase-like protein (cupin superfamily)